MLFQPSHSSQHPSSASSAQGTNPTHPNPHAAANAHTTNGNTHASAANGNMANMLPMRTLLGVLRADEVTIMTRKANIRRFGASWLRPMGVPKTLQGIADEMVEREEAAAGGRYVSFCSFTGDYGSRQCLGG